MKTCTMIVAGTCALLLSTATVVTGADASNSRREGTQLPSPNNARMNIVFLDDAAQGLPVDTPVRYNHWPEWDTRLPTFQKLLRTFIADFRKAHGQKAVSEASSYALEISTTTTAAERDRLITDYLGDIGKATGRATLVLARSTAGDDQLRLVYVLDGDCPPLQAAGFLTALAEVTPPVFHGRIGERFGPFRAPPTVVFDPRASTLSSVPTAQRARHRWALLEDEAYLLPHYVLHAIAALHEAPLTGEAAWVRNRTLEPGSQMSAIATALEKANHYAARHDPMSQAMARYWGNRAVERMERLANMPGGMDNIARFHQTYAHLQTTARANVERVALWNLGGGSNWAKLLSAIGVIAPAGAKFGGPHGALILGTGGAILAKTGDQMRNWNQTHTKFGVDYTNFANMRNSTFAGMGNSSTQRAIGGVLFQYDNQYFIDLSGWLAKEVTAAAHTDHASSGLTMGKLRYVDDLPLLWLDIAASHNGSLPVAVPRFLTAAGVDTPQRFGGPWSFEPLALTTQADDEGRLLRATVRPAETQCPVSYMLLSSVIENAPPVLTAHNATGFEPALDMLNGGGFVWMLRHGVAIEFDKDGLVEAIGSPHGERVVYVRQARQLVGQQTSDGRQIDLQYNASCPVTATLGADRHAAYEYGGSDGLVQVRGDQGTWSIDCASDRRPSRITSGTTTISLAHDEKGRLSSVECGPMSVKIGYLEGTNTLHIAVPGKPRVDWLLGPISGPVMEDRAILLTRSMAGRILQVSKGPVWGSGGTRQFTPTETSSLVP
jgi:hypothetical protein